MRSRLAGLVLVAALGGLSSGCLVLVQTATVRNPAAAFGEAHQRVARLEGRRGRARTLNALVWKRQDRQLVRVEVPLWLVRQVAGRVDWTDQPGGPAQEGVRVDPASAAPPEAATARNKGGRTEFSQDVARSVQRHVRLQDLERAGLGVFVEVEDDDEGERILVWLS
ncbi:MAG: hypothetical protein AB7O37_04090 [Vicinamibacteria bacterium]